MANKKSKLDTSKVLKKVLEAPEDIGQDYLDKEELKELLDTIPELAEELNDLEDEMSSLGKEIVEDFGIDEDNDNSDVIVQVHQDSPILEEDGKEDKHIKSGNSEESVQK